MVKTILHIVICSVVIFSATLFADDFDDIKKNYTQSAAIQLKANIILISEVFGDADTTKSQILIADDGRYRAEMNDDIYLFDGICVYEYSFENAQATVKCLKEGEAFDNQMFFIKNLDNYYTTNIIIPNQEYSLIKKDTSFTAFPDSLEVYIKDSHISRIEYFDINDDLNRVILNSDSILNLVNDSLFLIDFPDSVEIIKMP
ncbi:MAG: hypothetical protein ABIJ45_13355 [Candidatus Zixiibacteriota bacterium]